MGHAQDMSDTMFEETEVAKAVREMRARDPTFDMVSFLRSVRGDVQPVIQARVPSSARCWVCTVNRGRSACVTGAGHRMLCGRRELVEAIVCSCCAVLHAEHDGLGQRGCQRCPPLQACLGQCLRFLHVAGILEGRHGGAAAALQQGVPRAHGRHHPGRASG